MRNIVTWSALAEDRFRVTTSYIFLYIQAPESPSAVLPPTPALPFPRSVPKTAFASTSKSTPKGGSSKRRESLVSTQSIEKQLSKNPRKDAQGEKVIWANQRNNNYGSELWYIFLHQNYPNHEWFFMTLMAIIITMKEANIKVRAANKKKPRDCFTFEQFWREIFHSESGNLTISHF